MKLTDIKRYAQSLGYVDVLPLGKWRDYDVYEPVFTHDEVSMAGLPLVILVHGDEIRMSTEEEAFQQLDEMNG